MKNSSTILFGCCSYKYLYKYISWGKTQIVKVSIRFIWYWTEAVSVQRMRFLADREKFLTLSEILIYNEITLTFLKTVNRSKISLPEPGKGCPLMSWVPIKLVNELEHYAVKKKSHSFFYSPWDCYELSSSAKRNPDSLNYQGFISSIYFSSPNAESRET